jgi:uncharacterized protein (TIGR02217 family)
MTDFDNVRLELGFDYSAVGGPTINAETVRTDNGSATTNATWKDMLGVWDVGTRNMLSAEKDYLLNFFRARQGPARGFRLKDWVDYKAVNQSIGTGDGANKDFQLVKRYVSGPTTITRTITKPVVAGMVVYVDGVSKSFVVDDLTGIVTMALAPALNTAVTADFEFDVPVTFAQNDIKFGFKAFNPDDGDTIYFLGGLTVEELLNG